GHRAPEGAICRQQPRRNPMDPVPHLSRSVAGKVVFITGAASGMGRAAAHVFAREGAAIAVTDVRGEGAERVAADIRAEGGKAEAWALDVADAAAIDQVVGQAAERLGGLDILINNAGIGRIARVDEAAYDQLWSLQFDILLRAHQRTIRAALPHLRRSDS